MSRVSTGSDDAAFVAWVRAGRFDFAAWLNTKMAANYITSSYLARSLGCSKNAVNIWRRGAGEPDQQNREKIAALFDVDVGLGLLPELPQPKAPLPTLRGIVFR
jgi:transcriptional regulator with XRE-family HTH domain